MCTAHGQTAFGLGKHDDKVSDCRTKCTTRSMIRLSCFLSVFFIARAVCLFVNKGSTRLVKHKTFILHITRRPPDIKNKYWKSRMHSSGANANASVGPCPLAQISRQHAAVRDVATDRKEDSRTDTAHSQFRQSATFKQLRIHGAMSVINTACIFNFLNLHNYVHLKNS